MPGKPLSLCLIGAGRMGERWAECIGNHPEVHLTLVVDTNEAQGRVLAERVGARFATPEGEPWRDSDIDAVFVVTPHRFLAEYARAALGAGKHVFVEKPGARTPEEMRELIRLAEEQGRRLMVGFNYRHFSAIARAHEMVTRGEIGDVLHMRVAHGHPGRPGYDQEWRMKKEMAGGGVLMDQGMHVIDLAHWFMPSKQTRVVSATQNLYWPTDVEEHAVVILKNEREQVATLQVGVTQWKPIFVLEVYGTKGYVIVNGLGMKYGGNNTLIHGALDPSQQRAEETVVECPYEPDDCLRHELDAFAGFVRGENVASDGTDALRVLEAIGSVYDVSPDTSHL